MWCNPCDSCPQSVCDTSEIAHRLRAFAPTIGSRARLAHAKARFRCDGAISCHIPNGQFDAVLLLPDRPSIGEIREPNLEQLSLGRRENG